MKMIPIFVLSDGELVRRALLEDSRAGEELVLRYQRKAWAIVRAMGVRSDVMEDLVQESFLRAFGELRTLQRPGAFVAWFLTIVRNTARNQLRQSAHAKVDLSIEPIYEEEEPGEKADFEEYIWRKVEELPEVIREALYLYYHEGESTRAVAKAAGVDVIVDDTIYIAPGVETVDVTDALVKLYKPSEKTLKTVAELRKQKPLPLDQFPIED